MRRIAALYYRCITVIRRTRDIGSVVGYPSKKAASRQLHRPSAKHRETSSSVIRRRLCVTSHSLFRPTSRTTYPYTAVPRLLCLEPERLYVVVARLSKQKGDAASESSSSSRLESTGCRSFDNQRYTYMRCSNVSADCLLLTGRRVSFLLPPPI